MLRIAVLTDIHGNLPALEVALNTIERHGCDLIVHTGDTIGIGPFPAECVDRLLSLSNVRLLMGNHDEYFAFGLPTGMGHGEIEHQQWTHEQLDPDLRSTIAMWPYEMTETFDGKTLTFVHYPRTTGGGFVPIQENPSMADIEQAFSPYRGELIFYGHHHPYSDLRGDRRYINPGSLGCASTATARFCTVDIDNNGWTVTHQSIPYDDRLLYRAFEDRMVPDRKLIYKIFFENRF